MTYTLDNMGNRTKEAYKDPAGTLARTRTRVYDALNRLQQDIGGATPASQITQYGYDANDLLVSTTDPLARVTTQSYDALNRLMQVVDPFNGAAAPTKYEYDAQDNLTKVTDPKNLATVYVYNGFNELTSQTSPDTGITGFTYDNAGNLLTKTDARGVTATYGYDVLNRVSSISYPAYQTDPAETVTYTYDGTPISCTNGKGRLCSITDKTGTTTYSYDNKGRVLSKAQTTLAFTQTLSYSYNSAGQLATMTLPSGKVVAYTYLNNRVTGITLDGVPVVKNADYEPFGPIGEWTWGNDSIAAPNKYIRYFDLDGRTTKIESGPANGAIDPTLIVYDAASRITDLQKLTANVVDPAKSTTYGYDSLDRLTVVTPNAGNTNPARGFSYDGVGNRLTSTVAGSLTNYGYGTSSHRLNNLTGSIAKSYSYDSDGNRTTDGSSTWSYGGNNRPTSITIPGTTPVVVQAGINALGQRVTKTVNGTVTRFIYDEGGRLIGEYDLAGTARQETLWFNDLPVAVFK
ncbi:MAG: RHS repeat protein [Betaproteobacteria bacterium]|nr:RHS repeat protein [Betaproteobacteria bacterium]